MRKRHYAAAAGASIGLLLGAGIARHEVQGSSAQPCLVPLTMMQSDYNQLSQLTDKFVARHFNRQNEGWVVEDSTVTPTSVTATVVVGKSLNPNVPGEVDVMDGTYTVVLVRDCLGGQWRLATFHRA